MSAVRLDAPWLEFDLGGEMRVLSWALNRPGFVTARRILWREVRNADLPADLDVHDWLAGALAARGALDAVTFLTSRDIAHHHVAEARIEDVSACAVATVGLSNSERIGSRIDRTGHDWGTINIALRLQAGQGAERQSGLSDTAMIEALSIAASARTAAVMDVGLDLPTGVATGTGTDCIAVASLPGDIGYAGQHTPLGEAAGRAVYQAVLAGAREWMQTVRRDR